MKKTLFITMLAAALLGGKVYANTGFEGGTMMPDGFQVVGDGNLRIFENPDSQYEKIHDAYGLKCFERKAAEYAVVTVEGGIVDHVYGAYVEHGSARHNMVKVTGGTIKGVYGSRSDVGHENVDYNTVIVDGGMISVSIIGGFAADSDVYMSADYNKVYITNLADVCAPDVYGGYSVREAYENEVHLVGE